MDFSGEGTTMAVTVRRSTSARFSRVRTRLVAGVGAVVLVATAGLVAVPDAAHAADSQTTFDFPDFSTADGLTLNGDAAATESVLRLTDTRWTYESGSSWFNKPVKPGLSFESKFVVSLHGLHDEEKPADGAAFVIQSSSQGAQTAGESGIGLGYGGINPSVVVEFDDHLNDFDPDANHTAITTNGDYTSSIGIATPGFTMHDNPFTTWVSYDAGAHKLSVFASQSETKPSKALVSASVDLSAILGNTDPAYAGFTAGTGWHGQFADINSWSFGTGQPVQRPAYAYVAMGDSYSSGEGVPISQYFPNTSFPYKANDPNGTGGQIGCHRSKVGYAVAVADKLGLKESQWKFAACSGSEIPDLTETNTKYKDYGEVEDPQISFADPATTKLVTMTIGGNDVGFQTIMADCTWDAAFQSDGRPGCRKDGHVARIKADLGLEDLADGRLSKAFVAAATQIRPGGKLVVSGYPRLFGTTGQVKIRFNGVKTSVCTVGAALRSDPLFVSGADAKWINGVEDTGAGIIEREAKEADKIMAPVGVDVVYAPADASFHGHRLCDLRKSYLNGVIFYGANKKPDRRSFHPNKNGQSKGYANAFKAKI